jgi:rubrerythrin
MNQFPTLDRYRTQPNMFDETNEQLQKSLTLIKEAVQDEKKDQLFYEFLISQAPTQEEKEIIGSIRDDEMKHNKMFKQLYKDLTNTDITGGDEEEFIRPSSYLDGIKQAMFGELKAVEKYRIIRVGLPTQQSRDVLFEIITDELKHGSKYNYLYTLNHTKTSMNQVNREQPSETEPSLPDQWVQYIDPLVTRALKEVEEGINLKHLFQEFILAGVLVGAQFTPEQAIQQVEEWEKSGESKLLQESKKGKE